MLDNSEEYLSKELRNNKTEAYKFLFRKYYMDMLYYAISFGISVDDSKDLTQSAFVKLWENRLTIQDDKPVKNYLMAIVKNSCLDFIKHTKIVQNHQGNFAVGQNSSQYFSETPLNKLTDKELELKIIEAVASLPERCRQVFELSRFKGLKNIQIAQKLNISIKTVENQMTIALERLRAGLIDYISALIIISQIFF